MEPIWKIEKKTIQKWRKFVDANIKNEPVVKRIRLNVDRDGIDLTKACIWKKFILCQITTLSRSGPNSRVAIFLKSNSPALSYEVCRKEKYAKQLLERELSLAGLRMAPTRAGYLAQILSLLETSEWPILLGHLNTLKSSTTRDKELKVTEYLLSGKKYPGLGPKQARNFIQGLGLSRYEIPLDSRVLKKLTEFGSSFVPDSSALSDETVYKFVESGLQQIAEVIEIYPCILDACIFSSFDNKTV